MEWLGAAVEWWHWIVMGIVFVAAEIFVPSLVIIWLGIAALLVGAADYLVGLEFADALYLWTGLSVLLLLAWFGYFRKTWRSPIGQAEGEHVHIPGRITEKLGGQRYRAEFELPVLGDRRWAVECGESLETGEEVEVAKVYGQIIKVRKRSRK